MGSKTNKSKKVDKSKPYDTSAVKAGTTAAEAALKATTTNPLASSGMDVTKSLLDGTYAGKYDSGYDAINQGYDTVNQGYSNLNPAYDTISQGYGDISGKYGDLNPAYDKISQGDGDIGQGYPDLQGRTNDASFQKMLDFNSGKIADQMTRQLGGGSAYGGPAMTNQMIGELSNYQNNAAAQNFFNIGNMQASLLAGRQGALGAQQGVVGDKAGLLNAQAGMLRNQQGVVGDKAGLLNAQSGIYDSKANTLGQQANLGYGATAMGLGAMDNAYNSTQPWDQLGQYANTINTLNGGYGKTVTKDTEKQGTSPWEIAAGSGLSAFR